MREVASFDPKRVKLGSNALLTRLQARESPLQAGAHVGVGCVLEPLADDRFARVDGGEMQHEWGGLARKCFGLVLQARRLGFEGGLLLLQDGLLTLQGITLSLERSLLALEGRLLRL